MDEKRLQALHHYWRAANYLSAGQIYLKDNPYLRKPLDKAHVKKRLLGHWGTSPGLNLIYAHLNRLIQDTDQEILYVTGPGHGGPALRANVYLEGVMSEVYPDLPLNDAGAQKLMKDFSWPGGVPSHVSPPTPGSIHEGGELGYSLLHAYGAAFDHPNLLVVCVVGDGEAETGPLATSWHSNKFLNRKRDGAVLPILHLNGYKIAGPTLFGRMTDEELECFFKGCGYVPRLIRGKEPMDVHRALWQALDWAHQELKAHHFPLLILDTPKGWTGPHTVDGKLVEGTWRSHQVPLSDVLDNDEHFKILEQWLESYAIHELIDEKGYPRPEVLSMVPRKEKRMGASSHANGGLLLKDLVMPNFRDYALDVSSPTKIKGEATRQMGKMVRDIIKMNPQTFRLMCPDETNSNRFGNAFEVTTRVYLRDIREGDEALGPDGRVMEVLSEHCCQGWLEGYLLTGRHGLFPCYEAFALIVDSMLNQHGKWLKACQELPWRKPISSLNYVLTSHAWRQDHNGYSHQGPGFIESVIQKKSSVARIYLPPDANCLLSVADHCLRSKDYINLIISGKQPMVQYLSMDAAIEHCKRGASVWKWASHAGDPELVIATAGDTPTLEGLAATDLLRKQLPKSRIQFVNIVDLFRLMSPDEHPHGLSHADFEALFPPGIPVIFAFHGHPMVIGELLYGRPERERFSVYGYIEEGTTTTPFDMVVCNKMSRFHLTQAALCHLSGDTRKVAAYCEQELAKHKAYIYAHGEDLPEIQEWVWDS